MSNEELLCKLAEGDESALDKLCTENMSLIRNRTWQIAKTYSCLRYDRDGRLSSYSEETLSDLESVGMVAFIECIRSGDYDPEKGALSTYVVPRIDGAMRRHMESSLGTLSLDRDSMNVVRKVQQMHHEEGLTAAEIGEVLGIPEAEAARHLSYPTHFFSFYDLADEDGDEEDILSYLATAPTVSPEQIVCRKLRIEYLEKLFQTLTRKEQDILGKCYGVFGYAKAPLWEIAMYHMIKEDGVEKAKNRALEKLRERYPDSRMGEWDRIVWMMRRQSLSTCYTRHS